MPDLPVDATTDPFRHFHDWFEQARASEPNDPNAMTLATATPDGAPSARIVLLKGWDEQGFVFYTNKTSRKGVELTANPRAALLFHWKSLQRQIRIEGRIADVSDAEADTYYDSRARISRLGAWASQQSQPLPERADLEHRLADYEAKYGDGPIPRPPHWSGYRLTPDRLEFWQDMPFRLHDRSIYTRSGDGWTPSKLYP